MDPTTTQTEGRCRLNDSALLGMPTPSYMPMDPDGDGMDQQGRPMQSALSDEQRAQLQKAMEEQADLALNACRRWAFWFWQHGQSVARLGGLGSFGSIFGYKDGGPVGCSWA